MARSEVHRKKARPPLAFQRPQGPHQGAVLDDERLRRRVADVVRPIGSRLARQGGIKGDVHELGSVLQGADVLQVHEGGACVVPLVAQDAVQFQGMPHGLVDLEHHLVRRQHEIRIHGRAFGRGEQLQGLFRDPAGLGFPAGEIQQLPAPLVVPAPGAVGGTELGAAAVPGDGLDSEAEQVDLLLDGSSGSGDELGLDVPRLDFRSGLDDLVGDLHGLRELDGLPGKQVGAEGRAQLSGRLVARDGGGPDLRPEGEDGPGSGGLRQPQSHHYCGLQGGRVRRGEGRIAELTLVEHLEHAALVHVIEGPIEGSVLGLIAPPRRADPAETCPLHVRRQG